MDLQVIIEAFDEFDILHLHFYQPVIGLDEQKRFLSRRRCASPLLAFGKFPDGLLEALEGIRL